MSEKNFETFVDFGSSEIRIGVFDKNLPKINFFSEKNCISNFNLDSINLNNSNKVIEELIKISEKKIGIHINSINLMVDTPDLFSIDLSIKKNLEGKKVNDDDIKYLLQEAKQLIQNNYINPDFVVDISKYFDKKLESIKCFKSQFYNPKSEEDESFISTEGFMNFINARSVEMGHSIGVKHGEGFTGDTNSSTKKKIQ